MIRRNVLIFHQAAFGDFVATWPLAMAMGRLFPQSRIFYVTASEKGKLAERAIRVDSTDTEAGWHTLFGESPKLPEATAKLLAGAHTVVNFVARPDDLWTRNVRAITPDAKLFTMSTRAAPGSGPVTQWLVDDLHDAPAAAEAVRQMLRSIADRGLGTHRPAGKIAVLHPGSGSEHKNWPIERFTDLAARLKAMGFDVRITLGEVEAEKWAEKTVSALESVGNVVRPRTYLELYDLLVPASLFIGNDSGPGHLAAMIGVPTISLFGPTDPAVWKPIGPATAVVQARAMDAINLDDVVAAIKELPQRGEQRGER